MLRGRLLSKLEVEVDFAVAEPLFERGVLESRPASPGVEVQGEPFRVLDLFSGAGGLSEGFRQAGFQIVAGSDIDPDACATYALNFPEANTIWGDICQPETRAQVLESGQGVDVVVGGPPCQAFSQVRNHTRIIDDSRNSLYREFVKAVEELNPLGFVMENVPGMAQMGVLQQVKEDLGLNGRYEVAAQLLDAADFGVPQTRKRLIFIGVRRDTRVAPLMPIGSGASSTLTLARINGGRYEVQGRGSDTSSLMEALAASENLRLVSVAQAVSDLQYLRAGRREDEMPAHRMRDPESAYQRLMREGLGDTLYNVSVPRVNEDTATRLRKIPAGGNHRDLPESLQARYISGQKWGPDNGSGKLGRSHYYAYRKLHPAIWAWTLNTKADSAYHYRFARALSVREFARLQSFPDRFVFTSDSRRGDLPGRIDGGPAHSRYRQVGNAVPALLASVLGREMKRLIHTARERVATA